MEINTEKKGYYEEIECIKREAEFTRGVCTHTRFGPSVGQKADCRDSACLKSGEVYRKQNGMETLSKESE
ncbi:hypothetical protein PMAC_001164 [Pneumocystis sp. 'macacae']|nr:hypothetical protein PMAC_001164 [Pneumocystis sp. 'macacae']